MATDVGLPHYGWPHEDPASRDDSQEISVSQMVVDHGSISFGRYAAEPLSWEKRSVFTVNRRQEELDKCSAHGLVAQKKAYFEEFYKGIRAAKSSNGNQQKQTTLGSNVRTSCRSAEDETDVNSRHPGNVSRRNYDSHIEKTANGIAFENVIDSSKTVLSDSKENVQVAHPELLSSLTTSSSLSRQISQDVTQETFSIHAIQIENAGTELVTNDTLSQSREIIDPVGIDSYDNEGISGKIASSSSDSELIILAERSATFITHTTQKSKPLDNAAKREAPRKTNQIKQETASVPKMKKDHAPLSRGTTKVERRNKSLCKSLHESNPVDKQVVKADYGIHSSKTGTDKLSSNDMPSSVFLSRLLPERRSRFTIPRPFSFATEKRATAPFRIKGYTRKPPSNTSTRAAEPSKLGENIKRSVSIPSKRLTSSLPHAKDFTDVQGSLDKTTAATSAKEAELEKKSKPAGCKGRSARMLGSSETRSFDFPHPKESGLHGGSDYELENPGIKTKEKEALLSQSINLSADSKKPWSVHLSHDKNKLRQEKPYWR